MKLNPEPYNEVFRNLRWAQYEIMFRVRDAMKSLFTIKGENDD